MSGENYDGIGEIPTHTVSLFENPTPCVINDFLYVPIKLVDPSVTSIEGDDIPKYQTPGAVGFDIYVREKTILEPFSIKIAWSNFIIKVPIGYMLMVTERSSLHIKLGLTLANSVGIVDQDYCGNKDVLGIPLWNPREDAVCVPQGFRIAQGVFVKVGIALFHTVENMEAVNRGGFGSSGGYNS